MNHVPKGRNEDWGAASHLRLKSFYDAVFRHPDLAVYIIEAAADGSFRFEDANAAAVKLANRPLEEIRGQTPHDCLAEPIADRLEASLRSCIEANATLQFERDLDLPEGRLSWKTTLIPIAGVSGEPTHVVGVTRDISYETHMASIAEHHEALLKGLSSTLSNALYLYDVNARRVCFTAGAESRPLGYAPQDFIDMGEQILPKLVHPDDLDKVEAHRRDLQQLPDGESMTFEYRVKHSDGHYRRLVSRETVFSRNADGAVDLVLGIAEDVTEQERMQEEVRDLSERLLMLQLEERRLIAEELHDSTAQHLIAADLALERIRERGADTADRGFTAAALEDAQQSLREAKRELRVQTFLLHPPLLRSRGLADAIEAFASGFAARAGLEFTSHIDRGADRVSDEFAVALFRVCQEALTNVHRHAKASRVAVSLARTDKALTLTVLDNGVGIKKGLLRSGANWGVGLSGMRERMERLGGTVSVEPADPGTRLVASVPLRRDRPRRSSARARDQERVS